MDMTLALTLIVLALVDSTSIGTLVIPIWLLLAGSRLRTSQFLLYIGTIASFYFLIGLAVFAGVSAFVSDFERLFSSPIILWLEVILGAGMLMYAFLPKSKAQKNADRLRHWHEQVRSGSLSSRTIIGLAIGAGIIELATMLPFIAAIGLLVAANLSFALQILSLVMYVVVMVLPACLLLVLRNLAHAKIRPGLEAISDWMAKKAPDTLGWVFGIVGFLLARDGISRLIFPELF